MTLLQLQYFAEVCNAGSTLKAAQKLNVSQSTISTAIKALEEELAVSLFTRTSKGLVPNAAGDFFLADSQEILKRVGTLTSDMRRFTSIQRPIRIGIPVLLNHMYWADLYFQLKQSFPEIEFEVYNRTVPVLLDMLKQDLLDAILVMRMIPDIHKHCLVLKTETERYVSMSVSHPLAKESIVSYQQLMPYPVLRYAGDDLMTKIHQQIYAGFGGELISHHRFDQFSTLIQFLRKNAGIAFLNIKITDPYPDLVSIPIADARGQYTTYLHWSQNSILNKLPKRFFQVFKDYFNKI